MVETATAIAINVAISVALSLVTALLTPKQRVEGPRLKDRKITTSAYNEPIGKHYGANRLAGNVIWGKEIEEVANTQSIGKNVFSGGSQTTYQYFVSFAVSFGEGVADAVIKLYADGQLIYSAVSGEGERIPGLKFRFYTGSEDQLPDPLIEEDVDGREGAGSTPAFRGIKYIVFERLPLAEYGNRIPVIEAVIAEDAGDIPPFGVQLLGAGATTITNAEDRVTYDLDRDVAFVINGSDPASGSLAAVSLSTGELIASRTFADILGDTNGSLSWNIEHIGGSNSPYLILSERRSNGTYLLLVEKATLTGLSFVGERDFTGQSTTTTNYPSSAVLGTIQVGGDTIFLGGQNISGATRPLWAAIENEGQLSYLWGKDFTGASGLVTVGIQQGETTPGTALVFWAMRSGAASIGDSGNISIWRQTINRGAYFDTFFGVSYLISDPVKLYDGASGIGQVRMAWNEATNTLIFLNGSDGIYSIDVETGDVQWSIAGGGSQFVIDQTSTIVAAGEWYYSPDGDTAVILDAADGTEIERFDFSSVENITGDTEIASRCIWDPIRRRFYYAWTPVDGHAVIYPEGVNPNVASLPDVVSDICQRGNLTASDIDVTGLSGSVSGYRVERPVSLREMLEPLATAYNFDGAEVDGKLKFTHRDGVSDVTVAEADLVALDDGTSLSETRGQEIEAPLLVAVAYSSPDRDYQVGTQVARRIQAPFSVTQAPSEVSVELPISLTDTQAVAVAERLLYQSWIERERFQFQLPTKFLRVVPNDVLTVTASDATRTMRAVRVSKAADHRKEIEAVASETFVYSAGVPSVTPDWANQNFVPAEAARLIPFVMDTPLLRDQDSQNRENALIYASAGKEITSLGTFPAAEVQTSIDGGEYVGRASIALEPAWGNATTALAAPPDPLFYATQETTFTVRLFGGTAPSSVTQAQMVGEDANTAALWNATLSEWEIIGVRDITDNGDGSYTLGGILRGKRGTDYAMTGHAAGDRIVFLSSTQVAGFAAATSLLNAAGKARAIGVGKINPTATEVAFTHKLNSLKPYAPRVLGASDSGGDVTITWVRRTRVNGAWLDGLGGVPFSEDSESYEVDILAAPGGSVLRTLTATTPSATYTAAQIAADFGSPAPSSLSLKVYQMSAQIGRGFTIEQTVEIT